MTHLSDADLQAWERDGAGRDQVLAHLAVCDDCCTRVANALQSAPAGAQPETLAPGEFVGIGRAAFKRSGRARPLRAAIAVAGIAAVVALAVVVDRTATDRGPAPAPTRPAKTRGAGIEAVSPLATAAPPLVFRWNSPVAAARFRLEVADESRTIYSTTTTTERVDAPPDLAAALERGRRYTWRVIALDEDGQELARSAPVGFDIGR